MSDINNANSNANSGVDAETLAKAKLKAAAITAKLNEPYVFTRKATISIRENYSEYKMANMAYLNDGKSKIGGAIRSSERMRVNKAELDVYMASLLGEHPTSVMYNKKLDDYFSNIAVVVPLGGKLLNTSIHFTHKSDFINFDNAYKTILSDFSKNLENVKDGNDRDKDIDRCYKTKDNAIVALESTLYAIGVPESISDYILWRYCLVYRDVANDESRMTKSENIRFYLYDEDLKLKQEAANFEIQKTATLAYANLLVKQPELIDVLWALSNVHTVDIKAIEIKGEAAGDGYAMALDKIVKADPQGFLKVCNNKDVPLLAFIEKAVMHGLINRIPNTQVISDKEGNTIASSLQEAIVFFKNRELNGVFIAKLENQLNSL